MPRFFVDSVNEDIISLEGGDARHIALALRMKEGDTLTLCDGKGMEALCRLVSLSPALVNLGVISRFPSRAEPQCFITLFQALPKGEKMDLITQKAVELGANRIVPVLSSRCISRPDEKTMGKKTMRLQKIAHEAAMQSGRGALPTVEELMDFKSAIEEMKKSALPLFLFEHGEKPLREALSGFEEKSIAIMVGAEGGFSNAEADYAREKGIPLISLGPRILRCETAPIAALSAILFATGNME